MARKLPAGAPEPVAGGFESRPPLRSPGERERGGTSPEELGQKSGIHVTRLHSQKGFEEWIGTGPWQQYTQASEEMRANNSVLGASCSIDMHGLARHPPGSASLIVARLHLAVPLG